jgi:hypothetical protein
MWLLMARHRDVAAARLLLARHHLYLLRPLLARPSSSCWMWLLLARQLPPLYLARPPRETERNMSL